MVSWYETELCSEAHALDDSEEGLRNMYRIYRNHGVNPEILVHCCGGNCRAGAGRAFLVVYQIGRAELNIGFK